MKGRARLVWLPAIPLLALALTLAASPAALPGDRWSAVLFMQPQTAAGCGGQLEPGVYMVNDTPVLVVPGGDAAGASVAVVFPDQHGWRAGVGAEQWAGMVYVSGLPVPFEDADLVHVYVDVDGVEAEYVLHPERLRSAGLHAAPAAHSAPGCEARRLSYLAPIRLPGAEGYTYTLAARIPGGSSWSACFNVSVAASTRSLAIVAIVEPLESSAQLRLHVGLCGPEGGCRALGDSLAARLAEGERLVDARLVARRGYLPEGSYRVCVNASAPLEGVAMRVAAIGEALLERPGALKVYAYTVEHRLLQLHHGSDGDAVPHGGSLSVPFNLTPAILEGPIQLQVTVYREAVEEAEAPRRVVVYLGGVEVCSGYSVLAKADAAGRWVFSCRRMLPPQRSYSLLSRYLASGELPLRIVVEDAPSGERWLLDAARTRLAYIAPARIYVTGLPAAGYSRLVYEPHRLAVLNGSTYLGEKRLIIFVNRPCRGSDIAMRVSLGLSAGSPGVLRAVFEAELRGGEPFYPVAVQASLPSGDVNHVDHGGSLGGVLTAMSVVLGRAGQPMFQMLAAGALDNPVTYMATGEAVARCTRPASTVVACRATVRAGLLSGELDSAGLNVVLEPAWLWGDGVTLRYRVRYMYSDGLDFVEREHSGTLPLVFEPCG